MKERTCNDCGWVAFEVTREYAEKQVADFNAFYDAAPKSTKRLYGHRGSITEYERCFRCGGSYKNFREFKKRDCPVGCTLSPIIYE